jgi:predicted acetyltransferase
LALLLEDVRQEGLDYVELTTTATNTGSQRVITANGGQLVERFPRLDVHDGAEGLRYRIYSNSGA